MKLILLFFFALCGKLALSFNCLDITSLAKCQLAIGCSWAGSTCFGTYTPPACIGCVYVDPYNTGVSIGTVANPYKTLEEALLLDTETRVLTTIILNYKDETIVNQTVAVDLIGTHTIK